MTVQYAGFTTETRNKVLKELNYSIISYNGRINDAPRQYRHIFRDLTAGVWVIDNNSRKVLEQKIHIDDMTDREAREWGVNQGFLVAVANEIAEEDHAVFYYVSKEGVEQLDFRLANDRVDYRFERLVRRNRMVVGYYAYDGQQVLGPFVTFEDMILDLLQDAKYAYINKHADIPVARRGSSVQERKFNDDFSVVEISKATWAVFNRGGLVGVFFNQPGKEMIASLGI
jgi:hypothetical protein